MNVNPQAFRAAAMVHGLAEQELDPDPIRFHLPVPEHWTPQQALAVLLKLYDERGFVFFTNYGSRKAQQIGGNPRVALLFPWVALARQVQITGTARRIPTAESLRYFLTRPRGSQIGAWASPQSQVISSRSLLEQKVAEMRRRFGEGQVPLPDFWGGYRVEPQEIEFWQGRESRLHDRFRYRRGPEGTWLIERLAP